MARLHHDQIRKLDDRAELFDLIRKYLFTAVIGDIMDTQGLQHQFLAPAIQPLHPDMIVLGRAMPVMEADTAGLPAEHPLQQKPFGLMLEALDDLKPNEIYICTGSSPTYALWGELMSTRARHLGAAGAVLDGYVRDTKGILRLGFPTFCWGRYAQDQGPRGKVVDFRTSIIMGQVHIAPGDLVFGDVDGVLVIPAQHEKAVIHLALEKALGEQTVRRAIENGMSAVQAFQNYGIM